MTRLILAVAAAFVLLAATSAIAGTGTALNFNVSNVKNDKGKLVVAVFDSKEAFLKRPVAELSLDINADGEVMGQFSDLAPGTYAIAAYHDKNADGKLNTVVVVPREDYGFSNDARSLFGPPSFKAASFEVGEQDMQIAFKVR